MAITDTRFKEGLTILESKLDEEGNIIVENPHRLLGKLSFCAKGKPSEVATKRYNEIIHNCN